MPVITVKYDPSTKKLILPNHGRTKAKRRENILWQPDSRVHIRNIAVKKVMPTPFFSSLPHRAGSSENWKAVIHPDARIGSEYEYSIFWSLDDGNDIKEHDPIITIKPTNVAADFLPVAAALLALASLSLLLTFKCKKKKKSKKSYE